MISSRLLACLAAAAAVAALAAAPAGAAFPGHNGALVYHGKASASGHLNVRDADGRPLRRLGAPGPPSDPAFSPLGKRIAFVTWGHVWVMNADGTGPRRVTSERTPSRAPAWSPGGDALAFERGRGASRGIYRIDADGRMLRRVTDTSAPEHSPAWSSRDQIAFVRETRRGDGDTWVIGRGGKQRRLTKGRHDDGAPAWSPDGRRIAFTRGSPSKADIFVMRANGRRVRRLTRLPRGVTSPTWSPDGRRIAFATGKQGRRALHVMRSDGRDIRRVTARGADPRSIDWQPDGADPIVAAAADIACGPYAGRYNAGFGVGGRCRQLRTSDLLLKMDLSTVLIPGDALNGRGELAGFEQSFDPTWGRLKSLIRPAPGNHEYKMPGAAGYFDYFNGVGAADGPAGPRATGYYSFDVGDWHIVSLNSDCSFPRRAPTLAGCAVGSPQEQWLRADLAANQKSCVLAYWHHPPWSSGLRGINHAVRPLMQALYDHGVDILLTGHDHGYERFAPADPANNRDPVRGIRQFVIGTGGRSHGSLREPKANSEVRNHDTYGVLKLQLRSHGYLWNFVPIREGRFTDSGANACH